MLKQIGTVFVACNLWIGTALADPTAQTTKPDAPPAITAATAVVPLDPRIKRFAYSENSIYKLDLYLKSVTALQFSEGEEVQSILIGDSASWEVVKLKSGNIVSVKPTIASAATNMTIYTDKRVYSFELHCLGELAAGTLAPPPFRTVFTYPDQKKPKADKQQIVPAGPVDANYLMSGKASFRPLRVQDNGRQTTFFLPTNARRPAIFKVGPDRKEQLINSRTEGNRILVDGTSDYWVLRIGDESVCVGRTGAVRSKSSFSLGRFIGVSHG